MIQNIKDNMVKYCTAGLLIFLLWGLSPATADVNLTDRLVFDLINQYRQAPYDHAVTLGFDPLELESKGILPETQFSPYVLDEELSAAAADANNRTKVPETARVPHTPERQFMAETGAVLAFTQFIPADAAANFFLKNLFKSELTTGEFGYILSDTYSYAGVSMAPGVMDGRNAWLFSLLLGNSVRTSDIQVLNLINQIRADPSLFPSYIQNEQLNSLYRRWQAYYVQTLQFAPMFFNDMLYACARADVFDTGENAPDESTMDPDGANQDPIDPRVAYADMYSRTVSIASFWPNLADVQPVDELFSSLLINEISTWPYDAVIFSNVYSEGGAYFSVAEGEPFDSGDPPGTMVYPGTGVVSLFTGSGGESNPESPASVRIYGVLFTDHDANGIYAIGEEMTGHPVHVYDENLDFLTTVFSDNAGHFYLALESGRNWHFEVENGEQVIRQLIHVDQDRFVKMGFSPVMP